MQLLHRASFVTLAVLACMLLTSAAASAAPVVQMGITLLDTANNPLPHVGNVYNALIPGQSFRVQVTATLLNPNSSDANHVDDADGTTPLPVIQLGLQNITFDIISGT